MSSIFDDPKNKPTNRWWKRDKIGARIEGTLIDKRVGFDRLSGKMKHIYELKATRVNGQDVNGEHWNVQGGAIDARPRAGIDVQMDPVKLGQIVGFEYVGDKPTQAGLNPAKLVNVWQNPRLVDEQWVKENKEFLNKETETTVDDGDEEPFPTNNPARQSAQTEKKESIDDIVKDVFKDVIVPKNEEKPFDMVEALKEVNNIAVSRLGANTPDQVKIQTTLATGLELTVENLPAILEKMRAIPEKK